MRVHFDRNPIAGKDVNAVFTETAHKRGSDQMTVVELDTNRAAVNVSDGAGHRDICFFHFANAVASANTAGHTIDA